MLIKETNLVCDQSRPSTAPDDIRPVHVRTFLNNSPSATTSTTPTQQQIIHHQIAQSPPYPDFDSPTSPTVRRHFHRAAPYPPIQLNPSPSASANHISFSCDHLSDSNKRRFVLHESFLDYNLDTFRHNYLIDTDYLSRRDRAQHEKERAETLRVLYSFPQPKPVEFVESKVQPGLKFGVNPLTFQRQFIDTSSTLPSSGLHQRGEQQQQPHSSSLSPTPVESTSETLEEMEAAAPVASEELPASLIEAANKIAISPIGPATITKVTLISYLLKVALVCGLVYFVMPPPGNYAPWLEVILICACPLLLIFLWLVNWLIGFISGKGGAFTQFHIIGAESRSRLLRLVGLGKPLVKAPVKPATRNTMAEFEFPIETPVTSPNFESPQPTSEPVAVAPAPVNDQVEEDNLDEHNSEEEENKRNASRASMYRGQNLPESNPFPPSCGRFVRHPNGIAKFQEKAFNSYFRYEPTFILLLIGTLVIANSDFAEAKVKITQIKVPKYVENGTQSSVVLDCPYTLDPDSDHSLVVKWFFNDDPEPIYQWIVEYNSRHVPQRYEGRVNPNYQVPNIGNDHRQRYRALNLIRPTVELNGRYACHIISIMSQDSAEANMIVYAKTKSIDLSTRRVVTQRSTALQQTNVRNPGAHPQQHPPHTPPDWTGPASSSYLIDSYGSPLRSPTSTEIQCSVNNVYPLPELTIYQVLKDGLRPRSLENARLAQNVTQLKNGAFSVSVTAFIEDSELLHKHESKDSKRDSQDTYIGPTNMASQHHHPHMGTPTIFECLVAQDEIRHELRKRTLYTPVYDDSEFDASAAASSTLSGLLLLATLLIASFIMSLLNSLSLSYHAGVDI